MLKSNIFIFMTKSHFQTDFVKSIEKDDFSVKNTKTFWNHFHSKVTCHFFLFWIIFGSITGVVLQGITILEWFLSNLHSKVDMNVFITKIKSKILLCLSADLTMYPLCFCISLMFIINKFGNFYNC